MHHNAMSRWLSPLLAFCLSFLIIASLAPMIGIDTERQIDFWALWLVSMVILALPLVYLEVALAKRSKTTALNALGQLTRDSDASAHWRLVGWLAVVFMPFLAGNMLFQASAQLQFAALQPSILFAIAALAALLLSLLPRLILLVVSALAVLVSLFLAQTSGAVPAWQVTELQFSEWGGATVMALVATGLGLGAYWQSSVQSVSDQSHVSTTVLPIWAAQVLAVIAFGFFAMQGQISAITVWIGSVSAAALLIQLARVQIQQRQMAVWIQWLVVIAAVAVWVLAPLSSVLGALLLIWGLLICLIYAVFAGWIMKISHLRKAMNFSQEGFYNLWRIAVRIVLPLAIIMALLALLGTLF